MNRRFFLAALATLVGPAPAGARSPVLPLVTRRELGGTWEGAAIAQLRLFVLRLSPEEDRGEIVMVSGPTDPVTVPFRIDRTRVTRPGTFEISATRVPEPEFLLQIRGTGRSFEGRGELKAVVTLKHPDGQTVNEWPIFFSKTPGGFARWLANARNQAERALTSPPPPGRP